MDLDSNRGKGINAYIAPITPYSGKIEADRATYPKPKPGQEDLAHRRKFWKGTVDESKLPDGWYYWQEAIFQSCKIASGVVEIRNGEIVQSLDNLEQMTLIICDNYYPDLPPLIGTPKQVAYGESMRAKYLLQLWGLSLANGGDPPSAIALKKSPNEAKWWIEAGNYTPVQGWLNAALALIESVGN
jgi:hypothetical protein